MLGFAFLPLLTTASLNHILYFRYKELSLEFFSAFGLALRALLRRLSWYLLETKNKIGRPSSGRNRRMLLSNDSRSPFQTMLHQEIIKQYMQHHNRCNNHTFKVFLFLIPATINNRFFQLFSIFLSGFFSPRGAQRQ